MERTEGEETATEETGAGDVPQLGDSTEDAGDTRTDIPRPRDPLEIREVTVLSWNVWCHLVVGGPDMQGRMERVVAEIDRRQADIVCIQEVFDGKLLFKRFNSMRCWFLSRMHDLGYQHCGATDDSTTMPVVYGMNSGLLTFCKSPWTCVSGTEVAFSKSSDLLCRKGLLKTHLQCGPHGVCVINTHLDSSSEAAKRAQVAQVASATPNGQKVVATGDWNICQQHFWDDGTLHAWMSDVMKEKGLYDSFSAMDCITFPSEDAAYDHMFTNLTVLKHEVIVPEDEASDHCGILCTLQLDEDIPNFEEPHVVPDAQQPSGAGQPNESERESGGGQRSGGEQPSA